MKKVFKLWWGWNPGSIEKYLEEMAADGWRLVTVEFAQMMFGFVKDEPGKTSYCVDYQSSPSAEYIAMIEDDGWELVNKSAGWIMLRKDYEGARPKIYTDNQSLISRNNRVLIILIIAVLLQIPFITMLILDNGFAEHFAVAVTVSALYFPLLLLMLFGIARIFISNRTLQKQKHK